MSSRIPCFQPVSMCDICTYLQKPACPQWFTCWRSFHLHTVGKQGIRTLEATLQQTVKRLGLPDTPEQIRTAVIT